MSNAVQSQLILLSPRAGAVLHLLLLCSSQDQGNPGSTGKLTEQTTVVWVYLPPAVQLEPSCVFSVYVYMYMHMHV